MLGKEKMKSEYVNLHDDFVEILHNPNVTNKCYMIRITNYSGERYETMINKEDLGKLANLINNFVEYE
jgi:hypothetical protein